MTTLLRLYARARNLDVDVSIGALRATAATALLNAQVDTTLIKLVGRWRSDEVMRYFHTQAHTTDPLALEIHAHLR